MADSINTTSLEESLTELKRQNSSQISFLPLADEYFSVINGFEEYYASIAYKAPLEALAEYFTLVTHAKAYEHPKNTYLRIKTRPILMLRDLLQGLKTQRKYCYGTIPFPETFTKDASVYKEWMTTENKSEGTIYTRMGRIKSFLHYLSDTNCFSIEDITVAIVTDFIISLGNEKYSSQGRSSILYTVKNFFSCPYINSKLSCNPFPLLTGMHSRKHERLASFYTPYEIRKVLEAVDRDNEQGKMIYLMMLFACVYGLRISDIRQLDMSSINWKKNTILIYQQKTKYGVELPLTQQVCLALLDYIKNARPNIQDSHIFIKQRSPHESYSVHNHFANKVGTYFKKAGISTDHKHHGLHSMRHSLATELTSNAIPINEIATILGHTTVQSTMTYIWSDIKHLKSASLEVLPYGK